MAHKTIPIVLGSGREISKATLFQALHFGGWLTAGAVVFAWGMSLSGPVVAALDELMWIVSGMALTLGFRSLYRWARSASVSYVSLGLLALTVSVLAGPLWYLTYLALLRACFVGLVYWTGVGALFGHDVSIVALQSWRIPIRTWITCGCLLLTWSSLYFGINALIDLEVERGRVARAVKLADRARLSALQTQLNPHFLFNALNGIATLIRTNDRVAAASMIDALSEFLRSILQKLESPEIVVAEELDLINQYLQIERQRFGSRLRTSVAADPETLGARIPTMILQPLVENALRYGVLTREEGGSVRVRIRKQDKALVASVEDDGPGTVGAHSAGLGLRNSADRLSTLYGDDALISAGPGPTGKGFLVVIRLPFQEEACVHVGARGVMRVV